MTLRCTACEPFACAALIPTVRREPTPARAWIVDATAGARVPSLPAPRRDRPRAATAPARRADQTNEVRSIRAPGTIRRRRARFGHQARGTARSASAPVPARDTKRPATRHLVAWSRALRGCYSPQRNGAVQKANAHGLDKGGDGEPARECQRRNGDRHGDDHRSISTG